MAQRTVEQGVSIRLACLAFSISQTCYRYQAKQSAENVEIADHLVRLTHNQRNWGFGLCFLYLRNVKGHRWNHKRVYRIYRELELNLRIKPRKRIVREKPEPLAVPEAINQCWSMDFMHDQLSDGRSYRLFNVIDDFNREALAIDIDLSLPSERVIRSLDQIIEWRGNPQVIRSDNGPEYRRPWRGSAGMWTGTYHTAMEGALRVPLIVRWPGRVPAARVTNEIVHVVDLFPTLARIAGTSVPTDRPIDGVDQVDFWLGEREKSCREGFVYYIKSELRAVKWRDWKMHMVWEVEPNAGANHLETPYLFNLVQDPKEESDVNATQGWVRGPIRKMVHAFQQSLKTYPPVPPGAEDDYDPQAR